MRIVGENRSLKPTLAMSNKLRERMGDEDRDKPPIPNNMQEEHNTNNDTEEEQGNYFEILPDDHICGRLNEDGDLIIGYNPNSGDPYESGHITIRNKSTAIKLLSALSKLVDEMD